MSSVQTRHSHYHHSTIPEEIVSAGFPDIEKVILMGGGVLELNGLRQATDIDLVTTPANTEGLIASDPLHWQRIVRQYRAISDGHPFQRTSITDIDGRFDIWNQWYDARRPLGDRQLYPLRDLREMSVQHAMGFYVIRLDEMIAMKQGAAREKDLRDVALYDRWRR